MYVSNQVRQRRYLKGRRAEEENAIVQQEVLDGLISKDLGLDATADYMNRVNKRIADRIKKEMAAKNFKDFTTEKLVDERGLMGLEDKNVGFVPPSKDQLRTQAEKQAELDLIALFQQDVKESRKRQTAIDLKNLNDEEDYRVRRKFMNVLDDMMDEIKDREQQKQLSKNKYNEQRMLLDKMMNLIENQKMHDSYLEFTELASKNEFAKKIARNLKAAFQNKKFMEGIRQSNIENKAATTIQQKMADLRARKAAKNSQTSSTSTSVMSDAPESLDRRFGNNPNPTGRPKKSTTKSIIDYETTTAQLNHNKDLKYNQKKRLKTLYKKINEEMGKEDIRR